MSGTVTTGQLILTDAKYNGDGFGRIRTSMPTTLFEIEHIHSKYPTIIDEKITGDLLQNTSVLLENLSCVEMTANITGNIIRQSKQYIPYQPGKSKLVMLSGCLSVGDLAGNLVSRIGSFDDADDKTLEVEPKVGSGHFFEMVGNTTPSNVVVNVVERCFLNGVNGYETRVPQSSWNIDKLDGTGPSGLTIDFRKVQIYIIEIQWLGVGAVRMGINYNNVIYYCHRFSIDNRTGTFNFYGNTYQKDELPYMKMAKLPIRYEIRNLSTTGEKGKMRMMCSSVISEGGYNPYGKIVDFSSASNSLPVIPIRKEPNTVSDNTFSVVYAIKNIDNVVRLTSKLLKYQLSSDVATDGRIDWILSLNPTISSVHTLSYTPLNDFSEIARGNTDFTFVGNSGKIIDSGSLFTSYSGGVSVGPKDLNYLPTILSNMAGAGDVLVVGAKITKDATKGTGVLYSGTLLEIT